MPPADSPKIVTFARIAAERRDVALHPAQRRLLVHDAVVAGSVPSGDSAVSSGWREKPREPRR